MAFLKATKGLEPGSVCELKPGTNTIGRNAKRCDVVLRHYAVSREHALIQVTSQGTFIEDLGSRNGVMVNGRLLSPGEAGRHRLSSRDRIELAAFEFVFHDDGRPESAAFGDETRADSSIISTVDVGSDGSRHALKRALSPTKTLAELETRRTLEIDSTEHSSQDTGITEIAWNRLESLWRIIEQTGGTIDAAEAPSVILDSLLHAFPQTEFATILLRDQSPAGFSPVAVKSIDSTRENPRISQALLNYVVQKRQAVLSGDAHSDTAFLLSESAASLRFRSIMCVPLLDLTGEVLGVIELETSRTKAPFNNSDLAVLAGVARHLAIVLENAQLHAAMLRAQRDQYEARFRSLIEGSIQGVVIHRDFEPLFVNEAWARLHGYSVDEVLDMPSILPLIAPDDRRRAVELNVARRNNGDTPNRGEVRGMRKDGSSFWMEEFATVVEWDDGLAVQSTVADLTERKRAEEVLRQSRDDLEIRVAERTQELAGTNQQLQAEVADRLRTEAELQESFALYHSLVNHIPLCVIRKSIDGRITFVNRSVCDMFGLTPKDFLGKTDYDLFTREQADQYRHADQQVMDKGEPLELIETVPLPEGPELQIHTLKNPIYDVEGRVVGTQLVFWDITQQKRTEDERNRYATELERSNRELEQFAYNVSHDLQSPLRTIASYCQMLQKQYQSKLDDVGREYVVNVIDGTKRMKRLLDDLLEFSRVASAPHQPVVVDLEKVLDGALGNLASSIRENNAVVSHDPLPKVMGNPTQFLQLFQNLVNNALKYRRAVAPRVHVAVDDLDTEWQFAVQDNGEGISPQNFDRVFQIFQRLHVDRDKPGTGIGLSICKRIVERHGGRIWIESKPGEGSTFFFTIPQLPSSGSETN